MFFLHLQPISHFFRRHKADGQMWVKTRLTAGDAGQPAGPKVSPMQIPDSPSRSQKSLGKTESAGGPMPNGTRLSRFSKGFDMGGECLLSPRSSPPLKSVHNQIVISADVSPPCGSSQIRRGGPAWSPPTADFHTFFRGTSLHGGLGSVVAWGQRWVAFWW